MACLGLRGVSTGFRAVIGVAEFQRADLPERVLTFLTEAGPSPTRPEPEISDAPTLAHIDVAERST